MTNRRTKSKTPKPRLLAGKSIGVVGLGQIGGSIVRRLATHRPSLIVLGTDRNDGLSKPARRYCRWRATLDELVDQSDLLILSIPVPEIIRILPDVATAAKKRSRPGRLLVVDTGTIKAPVISAARRHHARFDFVGLHPLSGSERNGWAAGRANLFAGDKFILCGRGLSRANQICLELIDLLGAQPVRIDPKRHDRLIATTIGLPHMLAYAAQGLPSRADAVNQFHGRSWGTLTRVAVSDPAMVGGFLTTNRREQQRVMRAFQQRLAQLDDALDDTTGRKLEALLRRWRRTPE